MEKEKFIPIESSEKPDEETDEKVFQSYMEDLRLAPGDFNRKILDVGAGRAQFAKWANEHNISSQIYSVEPQAGRLAENGKSAAAQAEKMPFADGAFDLVVSVGAIPNVYLGGSMEIVKEKIIRSFNEMARVVKPGGEIRLARVLLGKVYENQRVLVQSVEKAFRELEGKYGARIEKIRTPDNDTYENGPAGHGRRLLAESYLLVIHKPLLRGTGDKQQRVTENELENLDLEPREPYQIKPEILEYVRDYCGRVADKDLSFAEWKKLNSELEQKADENLEYRLAYLRLTTKKPDMYVLAEMNQIAAELRECDRKRDLKGKV
jgi:ubiquinone/menaquinone biosynthesis C-methylase UbiE